MSHFTVLVIGDVESQLELFDENLEVDEYQKDVVSEEDIKSFIDFYTSEQNGYTKISKEEAEENSKLSFDELYEKHGGSWNGKNWKINENGVLVEFSRYNPKSKWDWYEIGGRWSGDYFKIKHGAKGIAVGSPGVFNNPVGIDVIKMGDVDWEEMKREGIESGENYFKKVEAIFGGTIPQPEIKWSELIDGNNEKYKDMPFDEKKTLYHSQPALLLQKEAEKMDTKHEIFGWDFSLEDFACGIEEYKRIAGEKSLITYAVVKDGEWYERGKMGWFGMSYNEKELSTWSDLMNSLLVGVDADEILTLVDCHI